MNYGEMKALVAFYLHRTDLDEYMPQFFELARERISKDARLIAMETTVHYDLIQPAQTLPADYAEMQSVISNQNGRRAPLRYYTKQALDALTSNNGGTPIGYTIIGGEIEIRPQSGTLSIDLNYFARPETLTNDADINTVLTNWPSLYLYSVLMYAANSIQDTETELVSKNNYLEELNSANDSDELARYSGDAVTMLGA